MRPPSALLLSRGGGVPYNAPLVAAIVADAAVGGMAGILEGSQVCMTPNMVRLSVMMFLRFFGGGRGMSRAMSRHFAGIILVIFYLFFWDCIHESQPKAGTSHT
jgi:hypothetical protein